MFGIKCKLKNYLNLCYEFFQVSYFRWFSPQEIHFKNDISKNSKI